MGLSQEHDNYFRLKWILDSCAAMLAILHRAPAKYKTETVPETTKIALTKIMIRFDPIGSDCFQPGSIPALWVT